MQPEYRNEILVAFLCQPVENAKIFVIDDFTGVESVAILLGNQEMIVVTVESNSI